MTNQRSGCVMQPPAKLNLFLEILGKRPDAYHELVTLMVTVSIQDSLEFQSDELGQLIVVTRWVSGRRADFFSAVDRRLATTWRSEYQNPRADGAENLVVRALQLLRARSGTSAGARVHLIKRIPTQAGLGGASSDAAAVLLAANQVWQLGWTHQQLASLAAELGSDVPYFLCGGSAICRGRGERVEPAASYVGLPVVVVRPPRGLSTADVYRNCQVPPAPRGAPSIASGGVAARVVLAGSQLFNRLQPTAEHLCPELVRLSDAFQRTGCCGHQMTGSGSSYFGFCRHLRHARRVANQLRSRRLGEVFTATTRPRSGDPRSIDRRPTDRAASVEAAAAATAGSVRILDPHTYERENGR